VSVVAVRNVPRWYLWLPGDPLSYEKWPAALIGLPIAARLVHQAVLRPVKCLLVLAAVYVGARSTLWLVPATLGFAWAGNRWAGSQSWATSGRALRSYRRCQVRGKLRQRWPKLMRDAGVIDTYHRPPPHGLIRRTDIGVATKVRHGRVAVTSDELDDARVKLSGLIGNCHSVRVRRLSDEHSMLYVNLGNPLVGIIPASTMPVAAFPRVTLAGRRRATGSSPPCWDCTS
jgi:hypothetical protein